ncbi:acyltransferase [Shewanella sp. Isolate8]|uniref:acyltransferase n=1 Tax=Shewanella sp. Isolate8 TaxID=2908529 RepID=UPI0023D836C0|nr:acyltransferase [Shewanella sp. Isolate8]
MTLMKLVKIVLRKINNDTSIKYKNLRIGKNCQYSLDNLDGIAPQLIKMGDSCVIAPKAVILTHDACLLPSTGKYIFKEVIIGNRVFIGYGAVIMPGVKIGDDCVIGSNSVVTKDVPSACVYAGIPAKHICSLTELQDKNSENLSVAAFDWETEITPEKIVLQQEKLGVHNNNGK